MSSIDTVEQVSLDVKVAEHLDTIIKERVLLRASLDTLDERIKNASTEIKVTRELEELEHMHTITASSPEQEREYIRSREKLKQQRKLSVQSLANVTELQSELDRWKAQREDARVQLREKDDDINETKAALRKLRLSKRTGYHHSEFVIHRHSVPEDSVAKIVGNQGSNLRKIENDCGVSIEFDRVIDREDNSKSGLAASGGSGVGANGLKPKRKLGTDFDIMGCPPNVQMAVNDIIKRVSTVTEEISIKEESAVCLKYCLSEDGQQTFLEAIQEKHDVRIEVIDFNKNSIFGYNGVFESRVSEDLIRPRGQQDRAGRSNEKAEIALLQTSSASPSRDGGNGLSSKAATKEIKKLSEGDKIESNYKGRGKWFPGKIMRDNGDKTYDISIDEDPEKPPAHFRMAREFVCKITGYKERTASASSEIQSIDAAKQMMVISSQSKIAIIGSKGETINKLCTDHNVKIAVSKEPETDLVIMGRRAGVSAAHAILKVIDQKNEEVEEFITASRHTMQGCFPLLPQKPTASGGNKVVGVLIELAAQFRVAARFEKDEIGVKTVDMRLAIKGPRGRVIDMVEAVRARIQAFESEMVQIQSTSDIVPIILGKKGAKINEIREEFKSTTIDIDADRNIIRISGKNPDERTAALGRIQHIIAANFVEVVPVTKDQCALMKSEKARKVRDDCFPATLDIWKDGDEGLPNLKLRGPQEIVKSAVALLKSFIGSYKVEIIEFTEEDEFDSVVSAPDPKSATFSQYYPDALKFVRDNFEVETYFDRRVKGSSSGGAAGRGVGVGVGGNKLTIRGDADNIAKSIRYIRGVCDGDIKCGSQVIPVDDPYKVAYSNLIGKGGAKIKELEEKFRVRVDVLKRRDVILVRQNSNGDRQKLEEARDTIELRIDDTRVNLSYDYNAYISNPHSLQKDKLNQIVESCEQLFVVSIQIDDTKHLLDIKGSYKLVVDAISYLNEAFENKTSNFIRLLSKEQFETFKRADFDSIKSEFDKSVKFELNPKDFSISATGDLHNMREAMLRLYKVIASRFPRETYLLSNLKLKCINRYISRLRVKKILSESKAREIIVDRALRSVFVIGSQDAISIAKDLLARQCIDIYNSLHADVPIRDYLLSAFVGRGGENISKLQKSLNVNINIIRDKASPRSKTSKGVVDVEIDATNPDRLAAAVAVIEEEIKKLESQRFEMIVDGNMVGVLIGKDGKQLKKLRDDANAVAASAKIDFDGDSRRLVITGDKPEDVTAAKDLILGFLDAEKKKYFSMAIYVPREGFPVLIGTKGAMIMKIQEESGAKIDLSDKANETANLKGPEESCRSAVAMIHAKLKELNLPIARPEPEVRAEVRNDDAPLSTGPKFVQPRFNVVPGMSEEQILAAQRANLSKNALRHLKAKEKKAALVAVEEKQELPVSLFSAAVAPVVVVTDLASSSPAQKQKSPVNNLSSFSSSPSPSPSLLLSSSSPHSSSSSSSSSTSDISSILAKSPKNNIFAALDSGNSFTSSVAYSLPSNINANSGGGLSTLALATPPSSASKVASPKAVVTPGATSVGDSGLSSAASASASANGGNKMLDLLLTSSPLSTPPPPLRPNFSSNSNYSSPAAAASSSNLLGMLLSASPSQSPTLIRKQQPSSSLSSSTSSSPLLGNSLQKSPKK